MTGAASRRRGANAERAVVNWMRLNGFPDARRYLAGDGRQPGDVDAIPGVCIEVKDRAQSAWPSWERQALAEAGPKRIAVVVRRERGNTDVGEWPARWCAANDTKFVKTTFGQFIGEVIGDGCN
jgi:hypothetical protein